MLWAAQTDRYLNSFLKLGGSALELFYQVLPVFECLLFFAWGNPYLIPVPPPNGTVDLEAFVDPVFYLEL